MKEEEFRKVLKKYQSGQASPEERRIIDAWYDEPGNHSNDTDIHHDIGKRYWANIQNHIQKSETEKTRIRERTNPAIKFWYTGMAASILLAGFLFFLLAENPQVHYSITKAIDSDIKWEVIKNLAHHPECTMLADGSSITLHPGSSVRIPERFNISTREVYLEGEAFFEVMSNEHKPFLVYTKDVTTTVLGTSFNVRAMNEEDKVIVDVKTGKVTVKANAENDRAPGAEVI